MTAANDNQQLAARPHQFDVVVVGAACLDIKGQLLVQAVGGTSNPGAVRITAGGCARNVAENLARLGARTALLSVVCEDDFGQAILAQTERAGVVTDHVLVSCERSSAAYMALLNADGQLVFGIDDLGAIAMLTVEYVHDHADLLRQARLVMIDANVPLDSARAILAICHEAGVPVGCDPVAYLPALRYQPLISAFALVTPNAFEAQVLTGMPVETVTQGILAAKQLVGMGVGVAVITLASAGVTFATADLSGHVPALDVEIVDTTGASDALTATILYGMLNDIPLDEAVRLGVSAAALTLRSTDTVCQDLSLESLYAQLII